MNNGTIDMHMELASGQHVTLTLRWVSEEMLTILWGSSVNITSMRYSLMDGTTVVRRRPFTVIGDLKVSGTINYGRGEPTTAPENPIRATAEGLGIPPVPAHADTLSVTIQPPPMYTRMAVAARDLLPGDNVVGVATVEEVIMGMDSRARDVARIRFLTDVNDDPSDDPRIARYPAETTFEIDRPNPDYPRYNPDSPAPY